LTYKKSPKYRLFGVIHKQTFIFEQPLRVNDNLFPIINRDDSRLTGCVPCLAYNDEVARSYDKAVVVHHPDIDAKKISLDADFSSHPENQDNFDFWRFEWATGGAIQGGSSGAGVFGYNDNDQSHRNTCLLGIVKELRIVTPKSPCDSIFDFGSVAVNKVSNFYTQITSFVTPVPEVSCVTTKTSCFDSTKNGTETAIDCGGKCPPCSYLGRDDKTFETFTLISEIEQSSRCWSPDQKIKLRFIVNSIQRHNNYTKFIYSLHNFHLDNCLKINSLSILNLGE